eukprot:CAMPEP_0182849628 /NCGR_PEP_ID=MMETSP0006_2-20121128/29663_1 /TAXON_ID=97485 /ORGANISM="Prymnesium parvum, Strain Texoma1" /LENGTH=355 /DNA_ID=CAMNT_0024980181 /DNA_START=66 /DNA_END=1134 /DNA_ORIENTATION=+
MSGTASLSVIKKAFPHLSDADLQKIREPCQRAQWAIYSGPFKLTPEYSANPIGAFPFGGCGLMTQKMDGMFMLWDGVSQMYNRGRGGSGSAVAHAQDPPSSFYKHLPPVELEGELATAAASTAAGTARRRTGGATRASSCGTRRCTRAPTRSDDPQYVRPVPFLGVAKSRRVVDATLAKVRSTKVPCVFGSGGMVGASYEGGEGVMIRDPNALYVYSCFEPKAHGHKKGQTTVLYKWLEEYGNDECLVLKAGAAEHESMGANSLWVSLPNGTEFALRAISRLNTKASDVKPGSIITFTYHGWSNGLPLNPSAQAFRTDRSWEDIKDNFIPPPNLELGLAEGRVKRQVSLKRASST